LERQCHCKATGMGGSDELFGIGAFLILEACSERVGRILEHAGIGRKIAVTGAAGAAPNGFRFCGSWKPPLYRHPCMALTRL